MQPDFSIFKRLVKFSAESASVFALAFRSAMLRQIHIEIGIGVWRRCCEVEKHTRYP